MKTSDGRPNFRRILRKLSKPAGWFTLVELIVVITILAILATVGFLSLSGYSDDARNSAAKANVRMVYSAIATESATSGNSPRYYVEHSTAAALSGSVTAGGVTVTLTGGDWNVPNTNYSAGNPRWDLLRLNPDKFRLSSAFPGAAGNGIAESALAAYDSGAVTVGAVDVPGQTTVSGRKRTSPVFQVAAVSKTKAVATMGNYSPASGTDLQGLVKDPSSGSSAVALVDSSAGTGGTGGGGVAASRYPGCDTDDIVLSNGQAWAACNVGATTAYSNQTVTLANATAAGGPTVAQKAYMGAYYQWGRNKDVTTGTVTTGPVDSDSASDFVNNALGGAAPWANYDWLTDANRNDNLWGGSGSTTSMGTFASLWSPVAMRGPCADWYHVPTQKEWCDAIIAISPTQSGGTAMPCDTNLHREATPNKIMTTLKLPIGGRRESSSAAFVLQGAYGYYWAASPAGKFGYGVGLSSAGDVYPVYGQYRAVGFLVRCLKN